MSIISNSLAVFPHLLFSVFCFGLQVACYVLLLPTILTFIFTAIRKSWAECALGRFHRLYFSIISTLLLTISDIDIGFYDNFNSHIDITLFDFFDEGPTGLIQTIWKEYHCVYEAVAFLPIPSPVLLLIRRIELSKSSSHHPLHSASRQRLSRFGITKLSAAILLYLTFLVIGLCGSIWRFPLQIEDTFVSNQKLLNDPVPGAIYVLRKAYKEKDNTFKVAKTDDLLHEHKFRSLQEALGLHTDGKMKMVNNDTLRALQHALFEEAGDSLGQPRPNIIIIYSESWSSCLFNLQRENAGMYFGLERHFKGDLLFHSFQSVQNGTVALLGSLYVSTPLPRFFASAYRFKTFPTSIALPFKTSNYTTTFMSGMGAVWENCTEALPHQQFDTVYDKFFILKDYPHAIYNSIGVYDEYLFQALLDKLNKPSKKRQMIAVMTTTNRPPFELPKGLKLPPLPDSFCGKKCFAEHNRKVLDRYLTGFRYYDEALDDLLNRFEASATARNTVLVITGDHNVRVTLNHDAIDKRYGHSAPLYVYLPPYPRKETYNKLTNRWESHDDILAALAPSALRNAKYFKTGKNLLDTSVSDSTYYSANVDQIEAVPTYQKKAERFTAAHNFLRLVYFAELFR